MSQKGKRPSQRPENDGDPPVKRRKGRPPGSLNKDHSKNLVASSSLADNDVDSSYGNIGLSASQAALAVASSSKSWQPKPHNDLKSIYNRSAPEAPAELFRKDLISAMKLPDSEPLSPDEYWLIVDQWKQEWERGVQVPVNPDSLPEASVNNIKENYIQRGRQDFKLPKNKYIRITKDESFSHEQHYLSHTPAMAESVCAYDLDQCDEAWLKICNGERALAGLSPISDTQFERVVEELEVRCWEKIQSIMKNEEGLGIEYDENVICDVCRSPDSEEANEMVFCDNCNICVHQACYGITAIPSGQWLCRTCTTGIKPDCVLCPNKGGAMKSTRSGTKWAHVSCALWIPEVSIGSVDRMEPITKISNIPQSRWALNCILCREKVGACIQCSVKTCKTAYHVTCAFQHGLEMRAIIEDEHNEDGVKLRSYCQKHSTTKTKKDGKSSSSSNKTSTASAGSGTDEDDNKRRRTRKEMTTEERNQVRAQRLAEIESEFHKHVNIKDISCHLLDIDQEGINYIYNYWILKRRSGNNRPLLPPKNEDAELASQKEENQEQEKMRMFVQLRQDLERVRNLCYMVSRREKLSRSFFKTREQIFQKQVSIFADLKYSNAKRLDDSVINAVIEANHGPSIYDKLYSSDSVSNFSKHNNSEVANNIDVMLDRLMNINSSSSSNRHKSPRQAISSIDLGSNSSLDKINLSPHKSRQSVDINGINNNNKKNLSNKSSSASAMAATTPTESRNNPDNPYKRTYFNGTTAARRSASLYSSTGFSSDSDHSRTRRTLRGNLSATSSENESNNVRQNKSATPITATSPSSNKIQSSKISPRRRSQNSKTLERKRRRDAKQESSTNKYKSNSIIETSSEDEENQRYNTRSPRNRTLQQMEKELHDERSHLSDSTDSDELTGICYKPISYSQTKVSNAIYSDSDSTDKDKTDNTASDSQQHPFRTKAAMKEFNINAVTGNERMDTYTNPLTKVKQPMPKGILKNAGEKNSFTNVTNLDQNKSTHTRENVKTKDKNRQEKSKKSEFPADLLVVPQRQAAKKASENLMRTNVPVNQQIPSGSKKDNKSDVETVDNKLSRSSVSEETIDKKSERKTSSKSSSRSLKRQESKDTSSDRESKSRNKEEIVVTKKEDASFADLLPYVPQRQAAKKAAEHIKSTVLKPSEATVVVPEPETKPIASKRTSSKKDDTHKNEASESSSSDSDSSCSSSSSESGSKASSSSSEESGKSVPQKVTQKGQSTHKNRGAVVSRRTSDKAKDLPFLDKGNKSAGTVFCSSETDSDSKSSSDESAEPPKQVPAKITKRKSSSAATSVSHKSTSSGVGTSTGTNTTSRTGRPRGRPRTKSLFKETETTKTGRPSNESKTPTSKKDDSLSRKLSSASNTSNTTPTKTPARGRRDSKVQIVEDATPTTRRRTSDVSPRATDEIADIKTRRRSITTRRESVTNTIKDKIPTITSDSRSSQDNKDSNKESKTPDSITTRKRKLSINQQEEKCSTPHSVTERSEGKVTPRSEVTPTKTDKTNDKASLFTPSKHDSPQVINEPSHEEITKQPSREASKTPVKSVDARQSSSERIKTPEKIHKSPIKKPTRTSSDMEIDPMNSPVYTPQISQFPTNKSIKSSTSVSSTGIITDIAKNNGPKSIFDIADELTETNDTHFEVPPTPLAFTSHHSDWLKVDANEDTEQATLDLVEKLRQNKQKMHSQPELPENAEADLNQQNDFDTLERSDSKQKLDLEELNLHIDSNKQQIASSNTDIAFDKPTDKSSINKGSQQDLLPENTIISQQKQQIFGQNQLNSHMGSPPLHQDSYMYGRRWNESEIIARRRSVSSSPASTVSDNTELQQQQQKHQNQHEKVQSQIQPNIPCSAPPTHYQQQKPNQQQGNIQSQPQLPKPMFGDAHQMSHAQQPMVSFPPFNQNQMLPQHRPVKPESCMFYNQSQQSQSKPAVGLQSSPTYQLNTRPMMYANRMPIGNKADDNNRNVNLQNYRQTNSTSFMPSTNTSIANDPCNIPLSASMGSPHQPPMQDLLKIKQSPQSNRNIMHPESIQQQPDLNNQTIQATNIHTSQQPLQQQHLPPTDSSNMYGVSNTNKKQPPSTVSLADIKKSPAKTVPKLSVRNAYQQNIENMQNQVRSPHLNTKMSPGKSPRQMDMISKQVNAGGKGSKASAIDQQNVKGRQRSNSTKNTGQSNRGRNSGGNKKGRGRNLAPFNDFDFGGTNHSNLAGTAYDLDLVDQEHFTLGNYRTSMLRDRKKSNDTSSMDYLRSREPSQSPKFSSPKNRSMYSSAANTPTTGRTPSGSTPLHQGHHPLMPEMSNTTVPTINTSSSVPTSLHEMVLPVLPGPVDMRTYNSNFESSTNSDLYNNHLLGAFDCGAADHTLADIDEEMEKELQSALKASNSKAKQSTLTVSSSETTTTTTNQNTSSTVSNTTTVITNQTKTKVTTVGPEPVEEASVDSDTMRVSFSDSRNQLKLKIKGPLAPDNYSSSTISQKTVETSVSMTATVTPVAPGLRRMRKKELLRQYWTQDANLDDQTSSSMGDTNPSIPVYSMPNRVAGIPKAVDSMSSIPTKEDYKDYNMTDTKKRKKVSGLQRELRQLSGSVEDETVERRRSIGNASDKSSNASTSGRSRMNRSGPAIGQTPKLKIKIGPNIIESTGGPSEELRQSDRPPKKRFDMVSYSMEDLKRDSLNFRKQIAADFDKKHKVKEKGSDKEKKKKKKEKKRKVEVIENNQKFVLKIKKPKMDNSATESVIQPEQPPNKFDPDAKDPLSVEPVATEKSAPIKLKLARTSGTSDSYTLTSKQDQKPAKKQNKKQASTGANKNKPKGSNIAPIKKRECVLQLEKLDPDTIQKLASNAGTKINALTETRDDVTANNDSKVEKNQPNVDSHLGAANSEINNCNIINNSSSNNNTNNSESSSKDEPVNKQHNTQDETKTVKQDNLSNEIKQKPTDHTEKDCEVR